MFIGHPAVDIQRLRDWVPDGKREHAVAVWVDAWKQQVPNSDPRRALAPMSVLGHLVYAVVYQRFLDNIEPAERIYHQDDPGSELRSAVDAATQLAF